MKTYWRYYAYVHGRAPDKAKAEARWWAVQAVANALQGGGQASVDLLVALANGARTDEEFAFLGAGPVEDVFTYCGASAPLDELEHAIASEMNLRRAFQYTWLHALPKDVAERLSKHQDG